MDGLTHLVKQHDEGTGHELEILKPGSKRPQALSMTPAITPVPPRPPGLRFAMVTWGLFRI